MSMVHPMARTTPRTRAEIHDSPASVAELAQAYNISRSTARKWRNRDDLLDRSHKAHQLHTTLSPAQELIVMEIRRLCLLPLDDLVAVTKQFINADASRSGVSRLLRREGLSKLSDLEPRVEGEETSRKTFKDYEPGFVHIDIKYLPKMPDEAQHSYLFVAIDRATRWVFMRIYADQTEGSAVDFLRRVHEAAAFKITKLLTDNGTQFTDRFTSKNKQASGRHSFDRQCKALEIEHRLSPPRRPQTNGMVERFNGRISEVIKQTRFASAAELASTLNNYWQAYNHHIPQRALGHVSPIDSLKNWHQKKPELFRKRIYKQAELDRYRDTLVPSHLDRRRTMATRLGEKLRELRKQRGLTLDKLADLAGLSKSYLWELENRESQRPSAEKLTALADALGVAAAYFLEEDVRAPEERHLDEAFFRGYQKLEPDAKEQLRKILNTFKKSS